MKILQEKQIVLLTSNIMIKFALIFKYFLL